jgi:hypothetical protein
MEKTIHYWARHVTGSAAGSEAEQGSRRGGIGNALEKATKLSLITGGKSEGTHIDVTNKRVISRLQCQRAMST